jgi:Protein of unknown function (DUF3800)
MLIAYFDDSGSHTDSDVVLWNGLFGNHYQWQLFNELWAAKLKEPSLGKEPLKRFHMVECQNSLGEFSGWSRTATDFLVHELGDIVLRCGLYSNGAAISRKDWDDLVKGDLRTALGDAEGYSMRLAFVRATKWAREIAFQDEMEFVFDRRKEREQEGMRIFDLFQHYSEIEQIGPAPVSIIFSDSYRVLPLQAADMLAWEQYQYARDFLRSNGGMKVAHRTQLQRLSKGGKITLGIALRSAIEKMVAMEEGNDEKIGKAAELMICDQAEFERRFNEPLNPSIDGLL